MMWYNTSPSSLFPVEGIKKGGGHVGDTLKTCTPNITH